MELETSGRKLDSYLKSNGISRTELARDAGIDLRTVSGICSGKREGNMSTWKLIANALGVKLDEIVDA